MFCAGTLTTDSSTFAPEIASPIEKFINKVHMPMANEVDLTDQNTTKEQLIHELAIVRSQLAETSQELTLLKSRELKGATRHHEVAENLSHCDIERKKVREEPGESKERLRTLIDQAPCAMAMFDRQMRYLSVSRRWLSDYKLGERDLIGLSHYDVFPEIPEYWKNIHRRALAGEELRAEEDRFERADGSVHYERWEVHPWKVSPDKIGGIIIYSEDITGRKQAEQALKEQEEKYRTLFETMVQGAFYQRSDGVIVDANPAVLKMIGITRDEGIGHTSYDFKLKVVSEDGSSLAPEEHPSMIALQTGKPVMNAVCGVSGPETTSCTWLNINAIPMFRSTEKRPYQVFVTLHDITDIKRTEKALRASEQRLHLALDSAFLISFEWDIERNEVQRFVAKDPALALTPGQLSNLEEFINIVHPEDRAVFTFNLFAAMEQIDGRYDNEFRIVRPDGTVLWLHDTGYYERDLQNRPIRLIGLSQDITDRKQAELELLQLNESLEQMVADRTALADARSKQLQALAVELIEAEEQEKRRLAGLLHEDLQQLLAAARFRLESKRHSDPDLNQVQHLLEESISKTRNMAHELSPAMLHHSNLADAIQRICLNAHEQFGLAVDLEAEINMPVECAPSRVFIFRAIQELLFNIVKHAGVNTAKVKIAESGDDLVIMVSDVGKGFDASALETFTGKTGLGLISLRERASYIGGSLTIESTPGKGSRFILRVPVQMDGAAHPHAPETRVEDPIQQPTETAPSSAESDLRVLFADDHKVMRQGLIRLVAGKPGILVVGEAANGREALEKVRLIKPDVVVMDISMPEMDGIEATRHIKAELPNVRVIGLSMHEDEHIAHDMREAGAEASLSKTTSSSKLLKAIYGTARDEHETIPPSEKKPTQLKLPLS
jgi:PAS domain S-box-containing protein